MKYVSVKKASKILECSENQLYALIGDDPNVIQCTGIGMQRKLRFEDVLEWRSRPSSFKTLLHKAAPPHTPIIHKAVAPSRPTTRKGQIMKIEPSKTDMLMQAGTAYYAMTYVEKYTGRKAGTIGHWIDKHASFKIVRLPNPTGAKAPKNYITEEAFEYVKELAMTVKKNSTTASRKNILPSSKHMTISKACKKLDIKEHVIRHLLDTHKIYRYGTGVALVSLEEVEAAHETTNKRFDKPVANSDLQSIGNAAKLIGVTDYHVRNHVDNGTLKIHGNNPKMVSMADVRTIFNVDTVTTPAPAPAAPRKQAAQPTNGSSVNIDKEILLKALEHPDSDVTNRVLNLLENA